LKGSTDRWKEGYKQTTKKKKNVQTERKERRKKSTQERYAFPVYFIRLTRNPDINLECQRNNKNFNGNPKCEFPEYKAGAETTTCLCRSTDTVLPTYELALEARTFIYRDYKTL
jgi:hypothetical protein